jgi:signal transduction histidine kinase
MISTIRLYVRSWHFWVVVVLLAAGIILHYPQQLPVIGEDLPSSLLGLERHSGERLIFLAAIVYGGLMFGMRTGVVIAVVSLAAMIPRLWLSKAPADAAVESVFTVVVGVTVIAFFDAYQRQKRNYDRAMSQLQAAQGQLQARLEVAERSGGAQERKRPAAELGSETAQRLAALSGEVEGLAASTGTRFDALTQELKSVQERLAEILAGMGSSG